MEISTINQIPNFIWYVHLDGKLVTVKPSRRLAREVKANLKATNVKGNVQISRSQITIGPVLIDKHS